MTGGCAWPTMIEMGSESDQARLIAERIARRVSIEPPTVSPTNGSDLATELAAMRASLSDMQRRLSQIETRVRSDVIATASTPPIPHQSSPAPRTHSPWLAGVNASHPSQERFGVEEATVSELVDFFQNEKTCSVEPGGKPCDHCAMCSSRGF
jgi:hypothetical protein